MRKHITLLITLRASLSAELQRASGKQTRGSETEVEKDRAMEINAGGGGGGRGNKPKEKSKRLF